jgi:hypothetical protein
MESLMTLHGDETAVQATGKKQQAGTGKASTGKPKAPRKTPSTAVKAS